MVCSNGEISIIKALVSDPLGETNAPALSGSILNFFDNGKNTIYSQCHELLPNVISQTFCQDGNGNIIPLNKLKDMYFLTINLSPDYFCRTVSWSHMTPIEQLNFLTTSIEMLKEHFITVFAPGKCRNGMLHLHVILRPHHNNKSVLYGCVAKYRKKYNIAIVGCQMRPIESMMHTIVYMHKNAKEWDACDCKYEKIHGTRCPKSCYINRIARNEWLSCSDD